MYPQLRGRLTGQKGPPEWAKRATCLMGQTSHLSEERSLALRVIPAYVTIYERGAGGETPQHKKQEKRKDPHGRGAVYL